MEDTAAEVTASDTPQVRQALVTWVPLDISPAPGMPLRQTACCSRTHENVQQAGGRWKSWAGHSFHGSFVSEQLQQREGHLGQWKVNSHRESAQTCRNLGASPGQAPAGPLLRSHRKGGQGPGQHQRWLSREQILIPRKFISIRSSSAPLCLALRSEFTS